MRVSNSCKLNEVGQLLKLAFQSVKKNRKGTLPQETLMHLFATPMEIGSKQKMQMPPPQWYRHVHAMDAVLGSQVRTACCRCCAVYGLLCPLYLSLPLDGCQVLQTFDKNTKDLSEHMHASTKSKV